MLIKSKTLCQHHFLNSLTTTPIIHHLITFYTLLLLFALIILTVHHTILYTFKKQQGEFNHGFRDEKQAFTHS
jgi:tellurite resistance protein TehA-like permease